MGFGHVEGERYIDSHGRVGAITEPLEQWRDALQAALNHDLGIAPVQMLLAEGDWKGFRRRLKALLRNKDGAGSETPLYLVGNHSPARYPYLLYHDQTWASTSS